MSGATGTGWPRTRLTDLLGVSAPVVQAPMAGGPTTPELVAAVSNAGGLGSLAAALLPPDRIATEVAAVRGRTAAPFAVNLFVLDPPAIDPQSLAEAIARLQPFRDELGLPPASAPTKFCESFPEQFDAVLAAAPAVASFTFGVLDAPAVDRLHAAGIKVIGTATHVAEARAWEAVGADAVCAQGAEAGGHRGTFLGGFAEAMIGTLALVPQVADAVRIPVIAAGGIMDGRGVAAALVLGAGAAQLGTAFLTCPESGVPVSWKARVRGASDRDTRVTRVFSGRPARGLVNEFIERLRGAEEAVPAYPIQNALTGEIRAAAKQRDRLEYVAVWAGQGAPMAQALPVADLMTRLRDQTAAALARV